MDHLFDELLYELRKQYGQMVQFVILDQSQFNVETGQRNLRKRIFNVPAAVLPSRLVRKFVYDIAYLAANKNFTYGGLDDHKTTAFLISGSDFSDYELSGYIIANNQRYDKIRVEEFGNIKMVLATSLKSNDPYAQHYVQAAERLYLQETAINEA